MVRFLFRVLSFAALLLAVVIATMDSIQSVSSSEVMLTSFESAWQELDAPSLELAQETLERYVQEDLILAAVEWTLRQPAFGVFLVVSLLLWMIGYRRPPASRFAA